MGPLPLHGAPCGVLPHAHTCSHPGSGHCVRQPGDPPLGRPPLGRPPTRATLCFVQDAARRGPGAGTGAERPCRGRDPGSVRRPSVPSRPPSRNEAQPCRTSHRASRGWGSRENWVLPTTEPWGPHARAGPPHDTLAGVDTRSLGLRSPGCAHTQFLTPSRSCARRGLGLRCDGDPFRPSLGTAGLAASASLHLRPVNMASPGRPNRPAVCPSLAVFPLPGWSPARGCCARGSEFPRVLTRCVQGGPSAPQLQHETLLRSFHLKLFGGETMKTRLCVCDIKSVHLEPNV